MIALSEIMERVTEKLRRQINPTLYTPEEFRQKARESHFVQSILGNPLLFVIGMKGDLETIAGRKSRRGGTDQPDGD
jgi:hypothetical protein